MNGRKNFKQLIQQLREDDSRYQQALDDIDNLFDRKNAGYAGQENPDPWANFRLAEGAGVLASTGCLIRMGDKYARLQALTRNPENDQVGESRIDTGTDNAVYSLIYVCLVMEEEDQKNLTLDGSD